MLGAASQRFDTSTVVAFSLLALCAACVVVGLFFLVRKRIWLSLTALVLAAVLAVAGLVALEPTDCSRAGLMAKEERCRRGDRSECERYRTSLVRCGFEVPTDLPRP